MFVSFRSLLRSRRKTLPTRRPARLTIECLEAREMPAVVIPNLFVPSPTLTLNANTSGTNNVVVSNQIAPVFVDNSGIHFDIPVVAVQENGTQVASFPVGQISSIVYNGSTAADSFSNQTGLPAQINVHGPGGSFSGTPSGKNTLSLTADLGFTATNSQLSTSGGANYTLSNIQALNLTISGPLTNLLGGAGSFDLHGYSGSATLNGASGSNTFNPGSGTTILNGPASALNFVDLSNVSSLSAQNNNHLTYNGATVQMNNVNHLVVLNNAAGNDNIDLGNYSGLATINLTQSGAVTSVRGGSGKNLIDGEAGTNIILPDSGTDIFQGPDITPAGVASGFLTPAQLSATSGPLSVFLHNVNGQPTVDVFGPTGAGFSIQGNWQVTSTQQGGQSFSVSGKVNLVTGLGNLPITIPAAVPLTIQTGSSFFSGYGQVTKINWNSPPTLSTNDPASPLNFLQTTYGLNLTAPGLSWGLALGSNIPGASSMPINPAVPYLYFTSTTGFSASFGQLSVAPYSGVSMTVVFDPSDPSLYVSCNNPGVPFQIGVSKNGYIPFTPTQALPGNPALYGNLISGASVSIDDPPLTFTGTTVINFDVHHTGSLAGITAANVQQLLTGNVKLDQFLQTGLSDVGLGIDGTVGVGFDKAGFNFSVNTAAASAVYLPGSSGQPGVISFKAGSLDPLAGTPLSFINTGSETVAGTVDTAGNFNVQLAGSLGGVLGTLLPNQVTVTLSNSGITLDGFTHDLIGLGGAHVSGSVNTQGNFTLTGTSQANVNATVLGKTVASFNLNAGATLAENSGTVSLTANLSSSAIAFGVFSGTLNGTLTVTPAAGGGVVFAANGSVTGTADLGILGHPTVSTNWSLTNNQIVVNLPHVPTFTIPLNFSLLPNLSITPKNAAVGQTVILKGNIGEPDPTSRYYLIVNWGDGTTTTREYPPGSNGRLVTLTHAYKHPSKKGHPYQVDVQWHDNKGAGNAVLVPVTVH
jgi:hypothetical protein